jgi:hypothetical protein
MIPNQFNAQQFPITGQPFNPAMFPQGYYPYIVPDSNNSAFKKKPLNTEG